MINVVLVGLGGALGSIMRFLMSGFINRIFDGSLIFLGTLSVNVIGSFGIGVFFAYFQLRSGVTSAYQLFFVTGLLGGFTTFSMFSYEVANLMKTEKYLQAGLAVTCNLIFCIIAVFVGLQLTRRLIA